MLLIVLARISIELALFGQADVALLEAHGELIVVIDCFEGVRTHVRRGFLVLVMLRVQENLAKVQLEAAVIQLQLILKIVVQLAQLRARLMLP